MVRDRAVGAMLGLAIGEAVAYAEGWARDNGREMNDMFGGGVLGLRPGQWAADTAMALALVDSLTWRQGLDEVDFMERLLEWQGGGVCSCTGSCVGIGKTTAEALARYRQTGDPIASSIQGAFPSNGSLVRIAPVAIGYWNDKAKLREVAETAEPGPLTLLQRPSRRVRFRWHPC